ncbi:MAG: hypothetical protein WD407_03705 [Rhodospirillales bacterium]
MITRSIVLSAILLLPVVAAQAEQVTVTEADCLKIVQHVPEPDVEYKPGVDVYGRAVAPADLGGSPQIKIPDVITFDLKLDLDTLSDSSAGRVFGEPVLGKISIEGHRVYFNGQPIGAIGHAELVRKCRDYFARKR